MIVMSLPVNGTPREVVHFLNRGAFGPRPGLLREILAEGLSSYIQGQVLAGPDPKIEKRIQNRFGDQDHTVPEMIEIYRGNSPFARKDLPVNGIMRMLENFYTSKVLRAVRSQNQLFEVVVDFWFNHFNVSRISARQGVIAYERDAIRPHVFGTFRDLLGATASHPAMLFYLDNYLNRKDVVVKGSLVRGINENYGRELLELHTVGVSAGYTQKDVIDAARVFTGWTLDHPRGDLGKGTGAFVFRAEEHDRGPKRVFGLELPAGGGREEGEKLLDHLAAHSATATFISRKMARRFVSDDPPPSVVDRCAQTFKATGGDLRKVVITLLGSAEFWQKPDRPRFKTPFEFVVSSMRALDAEVTFAAPGVMDRLDAMGMRPFHCTPPTGFSDRGADWVNPTYLHRLNFALDLASGRIPGIVTSMPRLIETLGVNGEDANALVSAMNREIFGVGLSQTTVEAASAPVLGAGIVDRLIGMVWPPKHPMQTDPESGSLASKVMGLILASPEMMVR